MGRNINRLAAMAAGTSYAALQHDEMGDPMMQAGFNPFAAAQGEESTRRLQAAALALLQRATRPWSRLLEQQLAFGRDSVDAVLEELARAGTDDPRRALLDWSMASGRRLFALWLRHLQQTSERIVESQREWLEAVMAFAKVPATPSAGAETPSPAAAAEGQAATAEAVAVTEAEARPTAPGQESGGDAPAEAGARRPSRREASAA